MNVNIMMIKLSKKRSHVIHVWKKTHHFAASFGELVSQTIRKALSLSIVVI